MPTLPTVSRKIIIIASDRLPDVLSNLSANFSENSGVYVPILFFPKLSSRPQPRREGGIYPDHLSDTLGKMHVNLIDNIFARLGEIENIFIVGLDDIQKEYLSVLLEGIDYCVIDSNEQLSKMNKVDLSDVSSIYQLVEYYEGVSKINSYTGIAIIEQSKAVTTIAAINYAHAAKLKIVLVDPIEGADRSLIEFNIETWKQSRSISHYESNMSFVESRVRGIEFSEYCHAVFFTNGLPYGMYLKNTIPFAHVDTGASAPHMIINACLEQEQGQDSSLLIVSPKYFGIQEEISYIQNLLCKKYEISSLIGQDATAQNVKKHITLCSYDILHICSHGGNISGFEIEVNFTDRDGNSHHVIIDEVPTFIPDMDSKMITVERKLIFRTVDDCVWQSKEHLEKKMPDYIFSEDLMQAIDLEHSSADSLLRTPKDVVSGSGSIQCVDSPIHGIFHSLAVEKNPFIFNNTCWSGTNMPRSMMNAGARAYIGTLWDIKNDTAKNSAELFYSLALKDGDVLNAFYKMTCSIALGPDKDIYIYWGLPGTKILQKNKE